MQENKSAIYRGTYLAQPFNAFAIYPESFDDFKGYRIGQVPIADIPYRLAGIPSRIKENQLGIFEETLDMDFLIRPLSDSIKVAETLYSLRPRINPQPGYWQEQTDVHHAFVRLIELWRKFEEILDKWAKTEGGAQRSADDLFLLEGESLLTVMAKFCVVLQEYGEPGLWKEMKEFVETSNKLIRQIEIWLRQVGHWA